VRTCRFRVLGVTKVLEHCGQGSPRFAPAFTMVPACDAVRRCLSIFIERATLAIL
jgi:hypothetical protein